MSFLHLKTVPEGSSFQHLSSSKPFFTMLKAFTDYRKQEDCNIILGAVILKLGCQSLAVSNETHSNTGPGYSAGYTLIAHQAPTPQIKALIPYIKCSSMVI